MPLPTLGKSGKRSRSIALRVTEETSEQLKKLAKEHNLSQADVITLLVEQEYKRSRKQRKS